MALAELLLEAGLPEGILQVVNGDKEVVDAILENETIQAVGFVGSTPIAEYIYTKGCANGKRVQCFAGAKNHMLIMPDADMDQAADALVGAGYGAAGERCMAISVAVPVGEKTAIGMGVDQDFDTECDEVTPKTGSSYKCSKYKLTLVGDGYFVNGYYKLSMFDLFAGLHLSKVSLNSTDGASASLHSDRGLGLQFGFASSMNFNNLGLRIKAMYKLNKQDVQFGSQKWEATANTFSIHVGVDFGKIAGL